MTLAVVSPRGVVVCKPMLHIIFHFFKPRKFHSILEKICHSISSALDSTMLYSTTRLQGANSEHLALSPHNHSNHTLPYSTCLIFNTTSTYIHLYIIFKFKFKFIYVNVWRMSIIRVLFSSFSLRVPCNDRKTSHTHTHTHMYTHVHTYMYRHTHTHIFRCTHIGVQPFARRGRQELSCRVSCVQAVVLNLFPSLWIQ